MLLIVNIIDLQMGATQLHRATPIHMPNEASQSSQIEVEGSTQTLGTYGQDQRNNRAEHKPGNQRPEKQRSYRQPDAEPEVLRPPTEPHTTKATTTFEEFFEK